MTKNKFYTSGKLMEAIRALDYKRQYKVCAAFYDLMVDEGFLRDDNEMCQLFHDEFLEINPNRLEAYMIQLHWVVNYMDNAIYEIDVYDPATFNKIDRALAPLV